MVSLENRIAVLEQTVVDQLTHIKRLQETVDKCCGEGCCETTEAGSDNGGGNSSGMAGDSLDAGTGE
jgi:hypothetical protein